MNKQDPAGHSHRGLSRRSLLQSTAGLLSIPFVVKATTAWAQEKLAGSSGEVVVYSYGGSFTEGARRYVFDPFTKATGIKVVDVVADYAEPQIKAMSRAGRVDWDTAYLIATNYPAMHEAGMFEPIDYSLWDQESLAGTPPHTRLEDAVVSYSAAAGLAYDQRAFPKGGPQNWVDFWDVKKFPGPRGLFASQGKITIQFALLAGGVARTDIWPLTDDKIDRALKKLDEIKPHITKWSSSGGEPTQLLINREYAMAAAGDGRVISAISQGAPIKFVWDGAYLSDQYLTILKGGPNTANAQKLIAFLNRAQIAAGWTQGTGYPGPNKNQLKYLPADLVPQVNVNPENGSKCIRADAAWLAAKRPDGKTNEDHIQERWLAWRAG
ncbi:ABC transporter substrate-binding protein [Bradyrhizobium sp. SRL28]|uniref:ABC transporter substrate-binding protein n=1 Tax=Bradyrhizobium sp. SRL28 TaxID=2836178 RepID=UPI001BDF59C0|nr:ABC transporter substrate-binding protein [Bradyrhizobium sp. SRL28]MBT1517381.1 ABC transporter substrate-binding protein [Bradyrhizobium sp. SRL28]